MTKHILVYGSLRRGMQAHRFMRNTKFVEEVKLPGYDMFAISWFPGIIPNPENKEGVTAELFEIPEGQEHVVKELDYFEGYFPDNEERSLFVRREVKVGDKDAIVYLYNGKTQEPLAKYVASGDWVKENKGEKE